METVNGVIIGEDGYLFLSNGGHYIWDFVSGARKISDETFETFSRNIVCRANYAAERGAVYHHVIYPDKQSILREKFPIKEPICLGEEHLRHSPHMSSHVLYPLQSLRSSIVMPVFQKVDTHLTDFGGLVVSKNIVDSLTGNDHTSHFEEISKLITQTRETTGDLGARLMPTMAATEKYIVANWITRRFHNNVVGGNNGIVDIIFSRDAIYSEKLLLFGDSFGRSCLGALSYFFSEIVFLRTPFFHYEVFDMIRPKYVISQNVERYLDQSESDINRPSFFMYPYFSNRKSETSPEFAHAFSAMLSYPRPCYHCFVDSLWDDVKSP